MHRLGLLLLLLTSCAPEAPLPRAAPWPEADELFRHDPQWMGSDGAYSTDLGNGRVLWLFGDSGIAKDASRTDSWFIRNSLAIQTGYDPSTASITFYWGQKDNHPGSFFPEDGDVWFWPGPAVRVGTGLIVFAGRLVKNGTGPFGFKGAGNTAFFIDDAQADPSVWQARPLAVPDLVDVGLGTASVTADGYLFVYGRRSDNACVVMRFGLEDAARGDLSHGELFAGGHWGAASEVTKSSAVVFPLGPSEGSVHWEPRLGQFVLTQTEGFGASTLALRTAPHPEGPWTEPRSFFRPEESFLPGAFVYAGKGHPELKGADLVVTYFPGHFDGYPPYPIPNDFYPRFVRVNF
jgi:hypothetical protein